MAVMRTAGPAHPLPPHAKVRETGADYTIELDVADFTAAEVTVELLGPVVTVRAEQAASDGDAGVAFRLRERLEESFRLPDDADAAALRAVFRHGLLELRVPKRALAARAVPVERPSASTVGRDAAPC